MYTQEMHTNKEPDYGSVGKKGRLWENGKFVSNLWAPCGKYVMM